jgi:hypothetical protein
MFMRGQNELRDRVLENGGGHTGCRAVFEPPPNAEWARPVLFIRGEEEVSFATGL